MNCVAISQFMAQNYTQLQKVSTQNSWLPHLAFYDTQIDNITYAQHIHG